MENGSYNLGFKGLGVGICEMISNYPTTAQYSVPRCSADCEFLKMMSKIRSMGSPFRRTLKGTCSVYQGPMASTLESQSGTPKSPCKFDLSLGGREGVQICETPTSLGLSLGLRPLTLWDSLLLLLYVPQG